MPKYSIIIPLYNKGDYIVKTVQSVLQQSFSDYELIVVNDGSTDNGSELLTEIDDSRLILINKENGGVSSARNAGISKASGEWITFMDADDIMYPFALETYEYIMQYHPGYDFIVAATDQSQKKYPSSNEIRIIEDYAYENAVSYAKHGFSLVNTDCVCIRRSLLEKVGYFNEEYTHGEDQDLWIRLSEASPFVKIDKAVAYYVTDIVNNSSNVDESKRKYAPCCRMEMNRSSFKSRSQKILQGCRVFFFVFPVGIRRQPWKSISMLLKYFDCVLLFIPLVVKYRILHKK